MGTTHTFNIKALHLFVQLLKHLLQWNEQLIYSFFDRFPMMHWATKATSIIIINLVSVKLLHKLTENN